MKSSDCGRKRTDSENLVGDGRDSQSSCRQSYKEEQKNFASDSPKNCPNRKKSAKFLFQSLTSYKFGSVRTMFTDVSTDEIFPDENGAEADEKDQNDHVDDCSSPQKKGSHETNEFEELDGNKPASISVKQPGPWKRAQRRMGIAAPSRAEARNPAKSPIQKATTFFRRNGVVFNRH
uniref:Uncharacterized protein n=1 Tax=Ditylum brightwellii TaxID=49249 RepID=A0A7S4QYR5_9STRA